jgi:hypothetical protein
MVWNWTEETKMRWQLLVPLALITATGAVAVVACLRASHSGVPFTHKWRQTHLCGDYAKRSGGTFTSGTHEPLATETFFSERLGTCVQAQTFNPNDYAIVDLTNGYSQDTWLFVCGPQGLYVTQYSSAKPTRGQWIEEGPRPGRPCEKLFRETLDQVW